MYRGPEIVGGDVMLSPHDQNKVGHQTRVCSATRTLSSLQMYEYVLSCNNQSTLILDLLDLRV